MSAADVCLDCHRPAVACRCRPVAHPPPSLPHVSATGFCLCGHDRGTHPGSMGGVCQSCECLAYQPEDTRPGVPEAMRRALEGAPLHPLDGRSICGAIPEDDIGVVKGAYCGLAPEHDGDVHEAKHANGKAYAIWVDAKPRHYFVPAPPPSPPAEQDRRAQLRADLRAFDAVAPLDELELLVELAHRIESGRRVYGEWTAASEKRDLVQEEHEEHIDGLVYSSMRRVRARRMAP